MIGLYHCEGLALQGKISSGNPVKAGIAFPPYSENISKGLYLKVLLLK